MRTAKAGFLRSMCTIMLAAVLLLPQAITVFADDVSPGQKITAKLSFDNIVSVNGRVELSNPGLFSDYSIIFDGSYSGTVSKEWVNIELIDAGSGYLIINATISEEAKPGSSCRVSFSGSVREDGFDPRNYSYSKVYTVPSEEDKAPDTDGTAAVISGEVGVTDSETRDSGQGTPVQSPGNTTQGQGQVGEAAAADFSSLNNAIIEINDLDENDYSEESWSRVTKALERSRTVGARSSQNEVDAAAGELQKAIAGLEKMDYSDLEGFILEAEEAVAATPSAQATIDLVDALEEAYKNLESRDKMKVEDAKKDLQDKLSQFETVIEEMGSPNAPSDKADVPSEETPQIVTETEEKERMHVSPGLGGLWVIIAVAVAAVVGAVLGVFVSEIRWRNRTERDTTPVVDYDIMDDE